MAEPIDWAYAHAVDNPGHSTYQSMSDPGRCLTCSEKSPAYALSVRPATEDDKPGAWLAQHDWSLLKEASDG